MARVLAQMGRGHPESGRVREQMKGIPMNSGCSRTPLARLSLVLIGGSGDWITLPSNLDPLQ